MAEKPNAVWVLPRIGRRILPALLGAGLWALTFPATAQPLEPGIQAADGRHFLLDDGAVRVLGKDFLEVPQDIEDVSALYQGQKGWGASFLALTDKGLARVSTAAPN